MARLSEFTHKDVDRALRQAEHSADEACGHMQVGTGCRAQCRIGALAAIGALNDAFAIDTGTMGIIIGPKESCEKGFEEIIVKSPLNKKVKICRLAPGYRKKDAPKGKPAHKGPLRRKMKFGPGIEHDEILLRKQHKTRKAERKLTR